MDAHQLLKAGRLNDAIAALRQHVAARPDDRKARTFLFELTCFTGDFALAEQILDSLRQHGRNESEAGVEFYHSVLQGEARRQQVFLNRKAPEAFGSSARIAYAGSLNGREFLTFTDADFRIGEHLEILYDSAYWWIPLSAVRRMQVPPPRRLRDLLWLPAELTYIHSAGHEETTTVVLPMMSPLTWQHPEEEVRVGRLVDWREDQFGEVVPYGLKSYLADDRHVNIAEIRDLQIRPLTTSS